MFFWVKWCLINVASETMFNQTGSSSRANHKDKEGLASNLLYIVIRRPFTESTFKTKAKLKGGL